MKYVGAVLLGALLLMGGCSSPMALYQEEAAANASSIEAAANASQDDSSRTFSGQNGLIYQYFH